MDPEMRPWVIAVAGWGLLIGGIVGFVMGRRRNDAKP